MFDWQAIGTHAVEMLVGGVGTWVFTELRRCKRDLNAAFTKIRDLEDEIYAGDPDASPRGRETYPDV